MRDVKLKTFGTSVNFNKLTADEIREGSSFNLVDEDGKFIGIFIVPISGFKKDQLQSIASAMNIAIGKA